MKHYYVITPVYDVVVPVLDYGQGPVESGRDVIEIEAKTRRDAIALGVKAMLNARYGDFADENRFCWCQDARRDGENPYAGVRAEEAEGEG